MKKLYLLLALFISVTLLPIYVNADSAGCDQVFYGTLRQWKQYTFKDDFSAWSSDKWLRYRHWDYQEQYDYNNSADFPEFNWTSELINNDYKVWKNQTMTVIRADRPYQIYSVPVSRSYDNFLIKYTLTYSTDKAGNNQHTHTECKYYEISRCGDGVIDSWSWYWEECDPGDASKTWWWNGWCSSSCKPINVDQPVCNSSYNGQRLTSLTEGSYLCAKWTYSEFKYNENTHKWTWKCSNVAWDSVDCWAIKPYCGDWIKDSGEACDYNDPNHEWWWNGWCDNSCKPITVSGPSCNSNYNGQRLTNLIEGPHLCTEWTYSDFHYDENTHRWTWKCNNTLWQSTDCSAIKPYCGDWIKDSGEACDYNDPNHVWWSELWCDNSCQPISTPSWCDETFYDKLRYGHQYTFYDDFSAWSSNKWLRRWVMEYQEQYDYNKSSDFPAFAWTTNLVNNNYMVAANTTMRVLQATSPYPILAVPAQRAYNNLFIKYTIVYSSDSAWTNKVAHSECAYYEITRCGDGIIDSDYWEECDPGSAWTSVLPDGRICNDECKIEDAPTDWILRIEKTLKDKIAVEYTGQVLKWEVKVWAEWWDVTDFEVQDLLPKALDYVSYRVVSNVDGLRVTWPTWPVSSWNNNIYTWDVEWTLREGHELIIEVETKVNKMPKSDNEYRNIACVIKDDNKDCDDDEPDEPTDWTLKVEKTLIGSKEIKNTWDAVVWNLKVTAVWWDVKNPIITDTLPRVLWYSGYMVIHNPWLMIHTPTVSTVASWGRFLDEIERTTEWILEKWNYIEIQLTTYAKVMPDKDYKNVLCARPEDNPDQEDCDDEPVPAPDLWIKKSFTDWSKTKTVKVWDEIAYKITFGNSGNASATITSIKDFLPKNVEYITGAIFLDGQSNHENTTWNEIIGIIRWKHDSRVVDGVYIDIYTWITLKPGESWYIILTWRVLSWNQDKRINFACIYLNGEKVDCDDATHELWVQMCEKLDVPSWDLSSGWGSKEVKCSALSWVVAEYIEIDCGDWVSWNRYITWSNINSLTWACTYPLGEKTYSLVCKVKVDWTEYSSNSCRWSVRVPGGGWWGCFPAWTKVTMADWLQKNIEDVEKWDIVLSYNVDTNTTEANVVKQRIVHFDLSHEMYELTINGNVLRVTDVHPFYVKKSDSIKDYAWVEAQNLKVWDILLMSDGRLVKIENINHYSNKETVYNLEVDGNHDYFVDKWYLVHNKWWGGPSWWGTSWWGWSSTPYCEKNPEDPVCELANPECFNVNEWNFSIEYGEILPFYLNIYRDASSSKDPIHSFVFAKDGKEYDEGTVDLGSLLCEYRILDPNNKVVDSGSLKCLSEEQSVKSSSLVWKWLDTQKDWYSIDALKYVEWRYWPTVSYTNSKDWKTNWVFGEYKFQLEVKEFRQYNDDEWKTYLTEDAVVCQSNFVLTEPYTVQKTPSGNLSASTKTLEKFKKVDGERVKPFSDYLNAIATSEYKPNDTVDNAMNAFINKYEKLAVDVKAIKAKNWKVKKVPWKHIYFIDWDKVIDGGDFTTPFTFVQTDPNSTITINWNSNLNMMILSRWDIVFKWDCTRNQNVKWIFYAQKNLVRTWVKKNDNLNNNVWCTEWWLNIKWVLIWYNFDNLMNNSRSHLENWFKTQENQKWREVMNWASVVIEYSPSIFTKSTMPPGAEDFTTALSIYKN